MSGARYVRCVHPRFKDERCSGCGFTEERAKTGCSAMDCPMKGPRRETPEELAARYSYLNIWQAH